MSLVCYNAEKDLIALWTRSQGDTWYGDGWIVWADLEYALDLGWEVIGIL